MGVLCLVIGCIAATLVPIGIIGVPFCLVTKDMARRDLMRIKQGRMDRTGETAAVEAGIVGEFGLMFCLFNAIIWGSVVLLAHFYWLFP
jgi:hypothetical protein